MPKKGTKRETIDTGCDKRYVRRDPKGKFKESDDTGQSLAKDQKKQPSGRHCPAKAIEATAGAETD